MSQQNAARFFKKMESDKDLRDHIADQLKGVNPADEQECAARIIEIALEKGYQFTAEEMKMATENIKSSELSDEVLDTVAGGYFVRNAINTEDNEVTIRPI